MTDQEYVKEYWESVRYADTAISVLAGPHYVILPDYPAKRQFAAYRHTAEEAWSAAAEYTRNRLEEIRKIKYEISLLELIHAQGDRSEWHPMDHEDDQDALLRTVSRLEAILADLKRGMKEEV
jgi:hypothetical protein